MMPNKLIFMHNFQVEVDILLFVCGLINASVYFYECINIFIQSLIYFSCESVNRIHVEIGKKYFHFFFSIIYLLVKFFRDIVVWIHMWGHKCIGFTTNKIGIFISYLLKTVRYLRPSPFIFLFLFQIIPHIFKYRLIYVFFRKKNDFWNQTVRRFSSYFQVTGLCSKFICKFT